MKLIFGKGPSLQLRLFLAIIFSISLMLADSRLDAFSHVRYLLNTLVSPLHYMADMPRIIFSGFYSSINTRKSLIHSNQSLKEKILYLKSDLMLLEQYREENKRLRKLLDSSFIRDERKIVTEVMAIDSTPYRRQVVIDKGRVDGVYEGQPVISENGIVGQVAVVAAHSSRVLLLIDNNSAIPVQVIRNDIRIIASGTGNVKTIQLEHIPASTDIKEGDLLVTSGLGGVYPEGYPVAYISTINRDNQREFVSISANVVTNFERLRYLLLIWSNGSRTGSMMQSDFQES
ncbi:rod shape-determining protein [Candidatus Photodesmus blepharus]|uniref:Cell shape-determining protein MreC n=1 Tax=Candidatus Photodesmus blepharonis TaxID=1179155 RepID=A0A084CMT6_9GAMM|nr:rod shape-determining protein MreC [Candidatus Photodesmus blepharus]KEY91115.1 rod shape-determining protein [Candidatus Photodesmus blepharus]